MVKKVIIVVGMGYGDEGKGMVVDRLCRRYDVTRVHRFNGGPQAAHNVVVNGQHHCFSQFGSGMLASPDCVTVLESDMVVDLRALTVEAAHLDALKYADSPAITRVRIDQACPLVTEYDRLLNAILAISHGHGSCGSGVAAVKQQMLTSPHSVLRMQDTLSGVTEMLPTMRAKETYCREQILNMPEPRDIPITRYAQTLAERLFAINPVRECETLLRLSDEIDVSAGPKLSRCDDVEIYEGAQGLLLDELYGFHPHTTWSDTTPRNALIALDRSVRADIVLAIVGVTRCIGTRHGPGPAPGLDCSQTAGLAEYPAIAATARVVRAADHNKDGFQGHFRVGPLNLSLLKRSAKIAKITDLAVTWMDAPYMPFSEFYSEHDALASLSPQFLLSRRASSVRPDQWMCSYVRYNGETTLRRWRRQVLSDAAGVPIAFDTDANDADLFQHRQDEYDLHFEPLSSFLTAAVAE